MASSKPKKTVPAPKSLPWPVPPATILGEMATGVIVLDRAGQPTYANPAALHLLGRDADDTDPHRLTADDLAALADLRDTAGQPIPNPAESTAPLPQTEERTWLVRRTDGTQVAVGALPAPLHDPASGEVVGTVHTLHSVARWYEQDATKEEFLSVASHELRAPLQPIMLASRFIQRWVARPEHREELTVLADQIVTQSKRLSQLVLDMINMTRINEGVFVIERDAADAANILRNVVTEQTTVTHRDIALIGADDPIPLQADGEKLWQAYTNLISNAIKYSPAPAPIAVTVTQFTEADGAPWLRVAVRDEGTGIAPDQVAHVFDRFFRAAVAKGMERQQQDGLGLGLYITRAIIESHGGRIAATSVLSVGSTFTIELPVVPPVGE